MFYGTGATLVLNYSLENFAMNYLVGETAQACAIFHENISHTSLEKKNVYTFSVLSTGTMKSFYEGICKKDSGNFARNYSTMT